MAVPVLRESFCKFSVRKAGIALWAFGAAFGVQADTIAYWPMNVTVSGSNRYVTDSTTNRYNLTVRSSTLGELVFSDNDTGWTLPPNADGVGAESVQKLTSETGLTQDGNYKAVLTGAAAICAAMAGDKDFTFEGWFRPSALPASGQKYLFSNCGLGAKGGWAWQFCAPDANDCCAFKVDYNCLETGRKTYTIASTVRSDELLNRWNHYALVHVAAKSDASGEWLFYLNGHLRGRVDVPRLSENAQGSNGFTISGTNSGTAQQLIGDLTCWRVSDAALVPGEFLCDVPQTRTVGYWTMGSSGSFVANSTGPDGDLTLRSANYGGVSFAANDIGWTRPPNPDPLTDNTGVWMSDQKLVMGSGEPSAKGSYQPVLTCSSAVLDAAFAPTNGFCVEGWYWAKELPASKSANHMFVYNNYSSYGGWVWNLYGADGNGKCAIKVTQEIGKRDGSASSRVTMELGSVDAADLTSWNHYALIYSAGQCRWKFYFNGKLVGSAVGSVIADMPAHTPSIMFFGCASSTAQIPIGEVTTWRVTRGAVEPSQFLCGDSSALYSYVWTGANGGVWSTAAAGNGNWKDYDGQPCNWTECGEAVFDGTGASWVKLNGEVNPSTILVTGDADITVTNLNKNCYIGPACERITKRGAGTFWFLNEGYAINKSANAIYVEEGTLRVSSPNGRFALGDGASAVGFDVFVMDGARLWVDQRNAIGYATATSVNNSRITVYTNGVFDLTTPAGAFNIQTIGKLDLLGGTMILPQTGHDNGFMQIRDRVTFGRNPTKTPFVFEPHPGGIDKLTWQLGRNPEFRVENITEDGAADVTFNSRVMALVEWENIGPCGFRKTGDGTMVLGQMQDKTGSTHCYPSGTVAVEAGELRVDGLYAGPTIAVGAGATLSGTGRVSTVTLAAGARLGAEARQTATLRVVGNLTIGEAPFVALTASSAFDERRIHANLLDVDGEVVGAENLVNATVTLNGQPVSKKVRLSMDGTRLRVHYERGMAISIR